MSKNLDFVKFDKVDKSYDGKVLVVKDLNLDIAEGEFITMVNIIEFYKFWIFRHKDEYKTFVLIYFNS